MIVVVHHAGHALHWAEATGSSFEAWLRWFVVYGVRRMSLGVPLFFVISGYCILASVEAIRRNEASPWTFLARRVRRVYPPYWVALLWFLAVVVALDACGLGWLHYGDWAVTLDSPSALDLPRWVGNLTLTETLRPHVWGPPRDVYTAVAWSLCYEEQFYFLCFLALLLAPRRVYMTLACLTLASMTLRVGVWEFGQLCRIAGAFPLLWHQFAVGLVVYYRLNEARTRRTQRVLDVGLGVLVLVGLVVLERETVTAAAFGLALIALRKWDDRADRIAWLNPLRACGRRCYSIYLVHLPVCVIGNLALYGLGLTGFWARTLVMIPLVSAAGVGASWAFFRGVESYFLNPPVVRRDAATPAGDPVRIPLAGEAMGLQA